MGTFSRLRYVVAANVNALIEKAEDPEKLLRALIREMEDASEEARLAGAELMAEQQGLERLQAQLGDEAEQWQTRAETAVAQNRDDLARAALKARGEVIVRHEAAASEAQRTAARVTQLEQDMATLKAKMADAKTRLKSLQASPSGRPEATRGEHLSPGERKLRRTLGRFDRLQAQVDSLEARVRSYDVGGPAAAVWSERSSETADPAIEAELDALKQRLARKTPDHPQPKPQPASGGEATPA